MMMMMIVIIMITWHGDENGQSRTNLVDITSHNLWHDVDQRFLIFNSCFLLLGHDNDHIDDNHCHQLLMKPRWSHVAQRRPTSNLSFSPRSTRTSCPTRPHSVISPSATTVRVPSARWIHEHYEYEAIFSFLGRKISILTPSLDSGDNQTADVLPLPAE